MPPEERSDLGTVCRRFFDAVEAHDAPTIARLIAPGAVLARNGGQDTPLAALADPDVLSGLARRYGQHRYEDVRQAVAEDAVTEQHRFRSTAPDGTVYDVEVCVVARFDEHRRIARLDEYGADVRPP